MKTALAIMVKTPGFSPVKTRLAAGIGQLLAERFYQYSVRAISELVGRWRREISGIADIYWAVAEPEAIYHAYWEEFDCLIQSEGDLGLRMCRCYQRLKQNYDQVILIGADSPQLSVQKLQETIALLKHYPVAMGPCLDGGFYLIGGCEAIPETVWTSVHYSQSDTRSQFLNRLNDARLAVGFLGPLGDVDEKQDLLTLKDELLMQDELLYTQRQLLKWLNTYIEKSQ